MAPTVFSDDGFASASEGVDNAVLSSECLATPLLPLFRLVSDDILVNVFARLEDDPRYLARLACVSRRFSHVVKTVCWKRQCVRIVPAIMPSPQTRLDQIPDPAGGWGALVKLLVCCPGLKHAGVGPICWDFGLERELGPTELYETQPRYSPKRRIIEVATVRGARGAKSVTAATGSSELLTTAATRGGELVTAAATGCGESVTVAAAGNGELVITADAGSASVSSEVSDSAASSVGLSLQSVTGKCSLEEKAAETEKKRASSARNPPAPVDVAVQGAEGSNDSKAASSGDPSDVQSVTEVSNAMSQNCGSGSGPGAVVENDDRSMSIDPPQPTVRAQFGSGRPPRGPVKRVHWNEEELALNAVKVGLTGSGDVAQRGRSRKRKERALKRPLPKIPEEPKDELHVVSGEWTLPREEGCRLLASRFRSDSLFICDWPGCVHPGEKRTYKLFRGFFKNFKSSLLWRNLKDMNARKTNMGCAFCSSTSTWDMMTAFCLRRSFEYHDDGEPVVNATVCEAGHVSGAWTDRPGVCAAL